MIRSPAYLRARFAHIAQVMGWPTENFIVGSDGTRTARVGFAALEYSARLRTYDVVQVATDAGELRSLLANGPFGARMSARELDAWISGILLAKGGSA